MKAKQGLQKLTDLEKKIESVFLLEKVENKDLSQFSKIELKALMNKMNDFYLSTKGIERDKFLEKFECIMNYDTKNSLWENNQTEITQVLTNWILDYGRMPSASEIATKCNLSRQTIHKHIKEFSKHQLYADQKDHFKFMGQKLLANVLRLALKGDVSASKLYFNIIGNMDIIQGSNSTLINNQNNFIQINGTVLNQETIKSLNPDQLNIIESILKTANTIKIEG